MLLSGNPIFSKLDMNKLTAFFRLIRWPNLLIMMLTMYILRYWLLVPLLVKNGVACVTGDFGFFLLSLSVVLLAAGGYIINDVYDVDADLINKPDKVIIDKEIRMKPAENIYLLINAVAIAIGIYISFSINLRSVSISFVLVAGLLYFYSTTYKSQLILGNLLVAFFAALVPFMVVLFELPLLQAKYRSFVEFSSFNFNFLIAWFGFYAFFAFMLNLIREIIKDMEDFEGDSAYGQRTLPVAFGLKTSKIVVLVLIAITEMFLFYCFIKYLNDPISVAYIIPFIVSPLFYAGWLVLKGKAKKDYSKASLYCKITMVSGILYTCLVKFVL